MIGTYARRLRAPDYPWAPTHEEREAFCREILRALGRPGRPRGSRAERRRRSRVPEWWAAYLRMGASPGAAVALTRMNAEIDVRHVLPTSGCRRSCCTGPATAACSSRRAATWRASSRARGSSSCRATTTCRSWATRTRSSTRSSASCPWRGPAPSRGRCSPRFSARSSDEPAPTAGRPAIADPLRTLVVARGPAMQRQRGSARRRSAFSAFEGPARAIRCASRHRRRGHPPRPDGRRSGSTPGNAISTAVRGRGRWRRTAARVAAIARPGEILVSGTVVDLVAGSGLKFHHSGLSVGAETGSLFTVR